MSEIDAKYCVFDTAAGHCAIAWNDLGIVRFRLPDRRAEAAAQSLLLKLPGSGLAEPPAAVAEIIAAIQRYFTGEKIDFSAVPVDLRAQDQFSNQIYAAARHVEWGCTTTYGALAKQLSDEPQAARDVGQAMAKNPVPLIIPCHRVLAAGGKTGGFSAPGGAAAKTRMLELEGVRLANSAPKQHSLLLLMISVVALLIAAGRTDGAPVAAVPAGAYTLDPAHASLLFKVNHLGFSMYTARFKRFQATLQFDPAALAKSQVSVTVDAASLETDFPDPSKLDFNAQLRGPEWLNTAKYPTMTFRSARVVPTGQQTLKIEGEFTLLGVTKPMTLDAKYNGGYAGHPMDPHARVGFSARGHLKRSDFGLTMGIPAPGTSMGVGDDVEVIVEAEFNGPPLATGATNAN